MQQIDCFNYRKYILGGLEKVNYDTVSNKNINMYLNYTTFIQTTDNNNTPDTFMIGYNIKTIDGKKIYIKESYIGD